MLAQLPLDARVAGRYSSAETEDARIRVFLGPSFCLERLYNFWSRKEKLDDFAVWPCGHLLLVLSGSVDGR